MSFSRQVLDWDVNFNQISKNSRCVLLSRDERIEICVFENNITYFLNVDDRLIEYEKIESPAPIIQVFKVNQVTYMIDNTSAVYDLSESMGTSTKFNEGFFMESSESNGTPSSSKGWRFLQRFSDLKAVTGIKDGFAAIQELNKVDFINVYKYTNNSFELVCSKKICLASVCSDQFFLSSLRIMESLKKIVNFVFKGLNMQMEELLVISLPNGVVSALPVLNNYSRVGHVQLFYEKHASLVKALATECSSLLLVYSSGKLVQLSLDKVKGLKSFQYYLPKKVVAISNYFKDQSECLVWSDGCDLHVSRITNSQLCNIKITHNIKSVQHVLALASTHLAVTDQCGFYKIEDNEDCSSSDMMSSSSEILNEIYTLGGIIEGLNNKLKHNIDLLYAYTSSKETNFKIQNEGHIIEIQNQTERDFLSCIWRIKLKSFFQNRHNIEIIPLSEDLLAKGCTKFPSKFLPVEVSLLANIGDDLPLLSINLGVVTEHMTSTHNDLENTLKRLTAKHSLQGHHFKEVK